MLKSNKKMIFIKSTFWLGIAADAFWAVKNPIERRAVALLTAFPVVFGILIVTLFGYLGGNTSNF